MARRSGFSGLLLAVAKDAARAQRQAAAASVRTQKQEEAEYRRQQREHERFMRENDRDIARIEKEQKQSYLESRALEVDVQNHDIATYLAALRGILEHTLTVDDAIHFESLRILEPFSGPGPNPGLFKAADEPRKADYYRFSIAAQAQPMFLERWIWGPDGRDQRLLKEFEQRRHEAERLAEIEYGIAIAKHNAAEDQRKEILSREVAKQEASKHAYEQKASQRNGEIDALQSAYVAGEGEAVVVYNTMVLERSQYPSDFPQEFRLAYVPESKELVVEYELPPPTIVPSVQEYKYVKTRDAIDEKLRKSAEIKELYQDIVAAITLRTIHEIFEADHGNHIQAATFNGIVQSVDPTTGQDIQPCLISIRATKDRFLELDLGRIEKRACLRNLGAQVSPRPEEQQAVKPIVDFDMVDKRFVEGSDVLTELESRPNLMDLDPFEFENLVSNLFSRMGLETKQTQSSRDGGVDAIAFDARPILGGKIVIQAKRYRHTVGVSAVRDLYGTMLNEGASKGILVSTSGYGPDAFNFAKDKPIELIDGGGLLYLLENHAGISARIIMPQD